MRSEPSGRCARCGDATDQGPRVVRAPFEWVHYLCESRGMDRPIVGTVCIPLCEGCWIRVDTLKASARDGVVYQGVPEDVGEELTAQEGMDRELDRFRLAEIFEDSIW